MAGKKPGPKPVVTEFPPPYATDLFPDPEPGTWGFNGIPLFPVAGANYKQDYRLLWKEIYLCRPAGVDSWQWEKRYLRKLFKNDLWALVFWGLRVPVANHPFVVDFCREVELLQDDKNLFLCARGHFKSTVVTVARNIQRILRNPEVTIGIFSHTRPAAHSFLRAIKFALENSLMLQVTFDDVLYREPKTEAPKWSETDGLIVKRKGYAKESTVEAHGLIEGMPTGKHYSHRTYDDIVTADLVNAPEVIEKLVEAFDMSQNLASLGGTHDVIGTPYHHEDLLARLRAKRDVEDKLVYNLILKPATVDGTATGVPVLLPQKDLDNLKLNRQAFFSQQLLDPTPLGEQKLDYSLIRHVSPDDIPKGLYRFIVIDPAGWKKNGKGDAWAIGLIGVRPYLDDTGASDLYILDLVAEPLGEAEALETIVRMYSRGGLIRAVAVEKVAMSSVETHVANALRAKGKVISLEQGNLILLRPGGRKKEERIVQNLQYPLLHKKIHMSTAVPEGFRQRTKFEMDKFPFWHDDILDMLSYSYDLIKSYRFGRVSDDDSPSEPLSRWKKQTVTGPSWMGV
jgi:hypothetical protein